MTTINDIVKPLCTWRVAYLTSTAPEGISLACATCRGYKAKCDAYRPYIEPVYEVRIKYKGGKHDNTKNI